MGEDNSGKRNILVIIKEYLIGKEYVPEDIIVEEIFSIYKIDKIITMVILHDLNKRGELISERIFTNGKKKSKLAYAISDF